MYYSEHKRVRHIESMLSTLAYASVGSDLFVAAATFLVVRKMQYSSALLAFSDYVVLIETALAGAIFFTIVALKYYRRLADGISLSMFRAKHSLRVPRPASASAR
ncbi:MAG: hypothetical protein M1390_00960 [Candidatus Marsarchaeota archaeon]|jgi:hypothetical protein|nr:hypothetical protein [Candidatus Marsarchaeota archaeon]